MQHSELTEIIGKSFKEPEEFYGLGLIKIDPIEGKKETLNYLKLQNTNGDISKEMCETVARVISGLYSVYGDPSFIEKQDNRDDYYLIQLIKSAFDMAVELPKEKTVQFFTGIGRIIAEEKSISNSGRFSYNLVTQDFRKLLEKYNQCLSQGNNEAELKKCLSECLMHILERAEELICYGISGKGETIEGFILKEINEHLPIQEDGVNNHERNKAENSRYFLELNRDYKPNETIIQLEREYGPLIGIESRRRGDDKIDFELITFNNNDELHTHFMIHGKKYVNQSMKVLSLMEETVNQNHKKYEKKLKASDINMGKLAITNYRSFDHIRRYK